MSIAPLTISGVSQFSTDFQTILNRAVQIAQIPVTQLQNRDTDLLQKKSLLGGLSASVGALSTSLATLGSVAGNQALAASSSNAAVVSVTNSGATSAATYTIDSITSLAVAASERSVTGVVDSAATHVSANGSVRVTVGTKDFDFTLTNNSLVGLRDKINSLGAGVTASILTTAGGNFLSVSANAAGATTLKITDDPGGANTALLTSANQGSDAKFKLNGIDVVQKSNVVNSVVPGITFNLLAQSTTPVTLSLQTDRSRLSSALQSFVDNLNTVRSDLQAQTGKNAGLLSGSTVVTGLQNALRQLTSFHLGFGTVKSLADLGVTFETTGKASFDQTKLTSLSDTQVSDSFQFLASATGLGRFAGSLRQFSNPIGGLIKTEQDGIDRTDRNVQNQIRTLTDRVNAMQTALSRQLAVADTLAAKLESQQRGLTASLQGLSLVLYGKNPT